MFFIIDFVVLRLQSYNYFPDYTRKSKKKRLNNYFFNYLLSFINYFMYLCTRFFRKHNDFSCDGELSSRINNLILE